ncbi:DNA mismatch repair protein PMS1 [Zancudomyces culisetae]|uniref:DNA mismatch repair protein PMS1 n=1 Tax=Zancudomyces culisetae TaxID=1213189 RepID=A0A1R1PC17_ZANCU|nr:DNA mismatch repair protein PMS1 [Zancudomyces culisetae]|eukprot:OMH78517.1 DNA mismatch repair protein PMS1 [Zancudomyces culisetae]
MEFIPTSKELQPNNTVQVDEQEKIAGLQGDQQRVSKNIEKVNVPDSGQPNNSERARDGTSTKESNAVPDLGSSVNHGNMMQTSPIRNSAVQNEANSSGYNATLRDFVTVDEPRPTRVPIRDNEVQNQTKRIEQDIRGTPEGSAHKSMVNLDVRSKTNPFRSPATPDVKAASDTPKKVPLPATRCLCLNRSLTATVSMSEIVEGVLNHGNQMDLDSDFVLGGDGDKDRDKDTTGSLGVAGVKNLDNDSAALSLSTILKKEDFGRMQVVGQFNLGFVVAKLDDDLFIVDQHASDEKSNFEELQLKSVISSQPLIR